MKIYSPHTRIAGRYEIASRPLVGGMGIVYLCHDRGEDRHVALKTFKPEYLPDRAARDRFLREGTAWVESTTFDSLPEANARKSRRKSRWMKTKLPKRW